MKHRQVGAAKVGVINADGHAIGIDIGATSVRAAVLAPGTHEGMPSVTLHGLGHVELPMGAVINGVVTDQTAVTRAIKQLWQERRFECRNVVLGISSQQVVVRDLTMPNLSPDQLAKALPFQAREIVAIPMDQAIIDFMPLGEPDPNAETITGLLIAAPRQPVLAAVAAVEKAGLKVARVDLSSFAALRAVADLSVGVGAVIDLGAHVTNIVIHNRGVPKVVRTVPRGGQELTERIADRTNMSIPDAEIMKCLNGLTGANTEINEIVADGIRPLVAELRSSLHYFSSTNSGLLLEQVYLTGGGATLPGLVRNLADQLAVPVTLAEPMQHIRNRWQSKEAHQADADLAATAVSIGLAMGVAA